MTTLKVSENRRFLVEESGKPFFYLGDTAWELFHRLNRAEAEQYLRDRAAKRFTVIQAVALAEYGGLTVPNPYGHLPLHDLDPMRPNEAYFEHVDFIVDLAASLGLIVGMLPTWGDKWNRKWGEGPEIFTLENAHSYGRFLGQRYAEKALIWILGGDRPIETEEQRVIVRAMAAGLQEGDGGRHLRTFHPMGGQSSSHAFPDEPWLDFHLYQSSHSRNYENWRCIDSDYALIPVKPCMDDEAGYEDHPAGFDIANGYLDDYDIRKGTYWALFSGACGHTYGCHDLWQFWQADRKPVTTPRRHWQEALHLPGASQMQHARALIESRPYLTRIPARVPIASEAGSGVHHVCATQDADGSYALIYLPSNRPVEIDLEALSGETLVAHWYDPRTGVAQRIGTLPRAGKREFVPPGGGPDWVLTLDDTARHYPTPGTLGQLS